MQNVEAQKWLAQIGPPQKWAVGHAMPLPKISKEKMFELNVLGTGHPTRQKLAFSKHLRLSIWHIDRIYMNFTSSEYIIWINLRCFLTTNWAVFFSRLFSEPWDQRSDLTLHGTTSSLFLGGTYTVHICEPKYWFRRCRKHPIFSHPHGPIWCITRPHIQEPRYPARHWSLLETRVAIASIDPTASTWT